METTSDSVYRTFPVDASVSSTLPRGARVSFVDSAGTPALKAAGATDLCVGVLTQPFNPSEVTGAPKQGAVVKLYGYPQVFTASGAVGNAAQLGKAANGAVVAGTTLPYVAFYGATSGSTVTGYRVG